MGTSFYFYLFLHKSSDLISFLCLSFLYDQHLLKYCSIVNSVAKAPFAIRSPDLLDFYLQFLILLFFVLVPSPAPIFSTICRTPPCHPCGGASLRGRPGGHGPVCIRQEAGFCFVTKVDSREDPAGSETIGSPIDPNDNDGGKFERGWDGERSACNTLPF